VVFFNYTTMQMTAKIVYYGPGLCGKTTNLQWIHHKTAPNSRGDMVSLETETDRTLFFDLLPLEVGVIGGLKVRLQLYTVPGQVFYNATRKLVLKGVDGIVFVADSQAAALDANVESLGNLHDNLAELGLKLDQVPFVLQYNKRDIRNIVPVEKMDAALNSVGGPRFEAAALHGIGVFETLKAISKLAIGQIRRKALDDSRRPAPAAVAVPAVAPTPAAAPAGESMHASGPAAPAETAAATATPPPPARPSAQPVVDNPLLELVGDAPTGEVEFAEEETGKIGVRPVETRGTVDIHEQLEKLRTIAATPSPKTPASASGSKGLEKRLADMLVPDSGNQQEVKRKASLEVPARLLKTASGLRLQLLLDGETAEEFECEALNIRLVGNRRLERLVLRLDLEIRGKG
jgi:signal recognition particle receptor subunit beta